MISIAVIGKNFGDEGKGLVTAALAADNKKTLVVRHNGGGQSGHTVERGAKRFVHRQIGSGAEEGADTLLSESFHPDLYQIGREITEFYSLFGFAPKIYAEKTAGITTIDDVLLNMALETARGDGRHGSCGMGINECVLRAGAGFPLTLGEAAESDFGALAARLSEIRKEYTEKKIKEYGIADNNPYREMLRDENVLQNFAAAVKNNLRHIEITEATREWLEGYDALLFETGQGLLLDEDRLEYAPHLTSSKTGAYGATRFLEKRNLKLDGAFYVTRTYVTRHGAGPLPRECDAAELGNIGTDETNRENTWQGKLRYGRHGNIGDFLAPALKDAEEAGVKPSLALTHLNETADRICFAEGDMPLSEFVSRCGGEFSEIRVSRDRENLEIYEK